MKTRRSVAVQRTHVNTQARRTAETTYSPGPFPWGALIIGIGVVGVLGVLTAPRRE